MYKQKLSSINSKGFGKFGIGMGVVVLVLIGVVAFFTVGGGKIPKFEAVNPADKDRAAAASGCPTDGDTTVTLALKNTLNSSEFYTGATVTYVDDTGKVAATRAGTAGPSLTYSAGDNLNCGATYTAYITGTNSYMVPVVLQLTKGNEPQIFPVQALGTIQYMLTDSSGNNLTVSQVTPTVSGDGWCSACTETNAVALDAGSQRSLGVKIRTNVTSAQLGHPSLPTYICADFPSTIFSFANGVTLSGGGGTTALPASDLPGWCRVNGYEKAWVIQPVASTTGERAWSVGILADLGTPVAASDVTLALVDSQYYTSAIGSTTVIKSGTIDDASADVGLTTRTLVIDNS